MPLAPRLAPRRAACQLPHAHDAHGRAHQVLGTMAHRVSARKIMYDPESAEGVMHVLSHPDSSQARPATYIIQAIDELKDMATLATLLSVPDACDTFWRESHSRREDIRTPARSILARAFGHSLCRKRLRIVERTKRLAGLFEQLVEKEKARRAARRTPMPRHRCHRGGEGKGGRGVKRTLARAPAGRLPLGAGPSRELRSALPRVAAHRSSRRGMWATRRPSSRTSCCSAT